MPERIRLPRLDDAARRRSRRAASGSAAPSAASTRWRARAGTGFSGRTPLRLYDPDGAPSRRSCAPGDRVRFAADRPRGVRRHRRARRGARLPAGDRVITRSLERRARRRPCRTSGASGSCATASRPSGPMDRRAFVIANRLVGNADGAAGLECTLIGPRFEVEAPCAVAVTGADVPVTVNGEAAPHAGDARAAQRRRRADRRGARRACAAYVAFSGGHRRAARARLARDVPARPPGRAWRAGAAQARGRAAPAPARRSRRSRTLLAAHATALDAEPEIRVVLGPAGRPLHRRGHRRVPRPGRTRCCRSRTAWARVCAGPRIAHARGHDIISDGIALGIDPGPR